jgi:DNA-3-methyladenine glycosylase I
MADAKTRCAWHGDDELYVAYHDDEWGVPEYDDRALFEKLILDGFQAGLSRITILRKREAFRVAFDGFNPDAIVHYGPAKVEQLMNNAGIVRNRSKIESTIANARGYLEIMDQDGFARYLWNFVDGAPLQNAITSMKDLPAETALSKAISKDLKARGFKFCGPTITYAFMQAVGMVNDHLTSCFRHKECADMASSSPFETGK